MKYVFGPVTSRRLGQSLGVDPIPQKTCNWNCVYCQLGRSRPVVNERKNYHLPTEIMQEVAAALERLEPGDVDWVSFAGSGEPVLHSSIDWLIQQVKELSGIPVAVITNGTFLYLPEVRDALLPADAVLPTLNAGTADVYKKINRPHPEADYDRFVEGLVAFAEEYKGKLWPEVVLVKGINDSEEALKDIANIVRQIKPDEVHINLPTRAPAESWVEPPDEDAVSRAMAILGDVAPVIHPTGGLLQLSGFDTPADAIANVVTRHPLGEEELKQAMKKWELDDVAKALADLAEAGTIKVVERHGRRFLCPAGGHFPEVEEPST